MFLVVHTQIYLRTYLYIHKIYEIYDNNITHWCHSKLFYLYLIRFFLIIIITNHKILPKLLLN